MYVGPCLLVVSSSISSKTAVEHQTIYAARMHLDTGGAGGNFRNNSRSDDVCRIGFHVLAMRTQRYIVRRVLISRYGTHCQRANEKNILM